MSALKRFAGVLQAVTPRRRSMRVLLVVAVGLVAVTAVSLAYLTSPGAGSGTVGVGSFSNPAAKLAFVQQPTDTAAGDAISPAVTVQVEDQFGHPVSGVRTVTMAVTTGPGTFTGGSTTSVSSSAAGLATFSNLVLNTAGSYKITASSTGLASTPESSSFTVTATAATKLVFTTQPTAGQNIQATGTGSFAVSISIETVSNTVVSSDNSTSVTLAIDNNAGPGGVLSCSNVGGLTVTAVNGVASFTGCAITKTGTGYTLTASSAPPLTAPANANAFNITPGTATKLVFTQQPVGGVAETTNFGTQPKVSVEDVNSNVVTGDSGNVTLGVNSYVAGNGGSTQGTLGCTNLTVAAVSGVATFAGCQITGTAGAGTYTLSATHAGPISGTSGNVVITAGTATKLVFTTQPVGGVAEGTDFGTSPAVSVEDANGNVVTSDTGTVTLAKNSGPAAGSLNCSNAGFPTVTAAAGVATFTHCQITGTAAAGTYTLTATRGGLTGTGASSNVVINVGTAAKLVFTQQPVGGVGEGVNLATQPKVSVEDAFSNVVTTDFGSVTLAINSYSAGASGGSTQGTIACTNTGGLTAAAASGVATFVGCQITGTAAAGTYTLAATRGGLTATGASNNVVINGGAANKLVFTTPPVGGVTEGTNFGTSPVVSVEDANSNIVVGDSGTVTLAINSYAAGNGGSTQGTIACTNTGGLTATAASGVATFAGCKITGTAAAGTYTLKATRTGLTQDISSNVSIIAGTATKLVFTTQPVGGVTEGTNFGTSPVVSVEDANSNIVVGDSGTVTLAINSYAAGNGGSTQGTIACTNAGGLTATAASGVATFAGCQITGTAAAGTYTVAATRGGLTATGASNNVVINAGTATKLGFTTSPSNSTGGVAFSPNQPVVAVQDARGNTVTGVAATPITLAILNDAGPGGALTCTTNPVTTSSGVATFAGCKIDKAGNGYTLKATGGGFTQGNSSAFNITAGAATKFIITASSGSITAGGTTNLSITAIDAGGNTATGYTGTQSLTFSGANTAPDATDKPTVTNNAGTAVAFGTAENITFSNGVATVSAGNNGAATLYAAETASISAAAAGVTTQTAASVTVSAGAAAKLAWTHITSSSATPIPSPCLFTCSYATFGNNSTFTANVGVTDTFGNTVSGLGAGHTVSVTRGGDGGAFTTQSAANPQTLTISSTGLADSTAQFSFKAQNSVWTSDTLTAHVTGGTAYPDATATLFKS